MRISTIVISIIIFSGLTIGLSSIYTDMTEKYDVTNTTSSARIRSMNATNQIQATLGSMQNKTTNIAGKVAAFDITAFYDIGTLLFDIPVLIFQIPNILDGMITALAEPALGKLVVPSWFIVMVIGIITAIFVFAVLSMFLKREI